MMDKSKTVSFFTRDSQIKDQLAAVGDPIEEKELMLTTLNGFPSYWDVFVQGVQGKSYPSLISYGQVALKKTQG